MVATHRLGKPAELNIEYAKVHGATVWQKRVLWMLCGYVAYSIGSAWINAIATFTSTGVAIGKMGAAVTGATNVIVFAAGWAAFLAIAYLQSKKSAAGPDRISWNGALLAGFALLVGMGLENAGLLLLNTSVEIAEISEAFVWQIYGGMVVHTCVFVAIAVLMRTLSEPKPTSAVETTS